MVEQHVNAAKGAFYRRLRHNSDYGYPNYTYACRRRLQRLRGCLVGGADFDGDADFDGGSDIAQSDLGAFGMKLLGIRSIMAFLCIFSWVGYTCVYLMDWWWALLIGVGAGVAASLLVALLMTLVERTQTDGTTNIRRAIGCSAEVYLRIPAERSGTGKINVIVQEKMVEVNAVTDENEDIPTGAAVVVDSVVSDGLVVVKKQ